MDSADLVTNTAVDKNDKSIPWYKRLMAWHLLIITFGFIFTWQVVLMWLWTTFPSLDNTLLRFSLSNSDAMSISAYALSIYAMWCLEQKIEQMNKTQNSKLFILVSKIDEKLNNKMKTNEDMDKMANKIVMILNMFEKLDENKLNKLFESYTKKIDEAQTFEDMKKDFDENALVNIGA